MSGKPGAYGNRVIVWLLPVIGLVQFIGLTVLNKIPRVFIYPVEITKKNATMQYSLATRMMRTLKFVITTEFAYMTYHTIQTGLGQGAGLGAFFLPVAPLLTLGTVAYYTFMVLKNK